MNADAELNQTLLNAMFALNEAGDNLDEIYRIGLETAVTLLNANRACIFERDHFKQDTWKRTNTIHADSTEKSLAGEFTVLPEELNPNDGDFYVASNQISYPIKIYHWTFCIFYFEGVNLHKNFQNQSQTIEKFFQQISIFVKKAFQNQEFFEFLHSYFHEVYRPLGFMTGYADLLSLNFAH